MSTEKIYNNLLAQLDKLFRHCRQGSIKTRQRYLEATKRFCRFLADGYRMEKLANTAPKHVYAYVANMKSRNLSVATIKTDLSAIRFWHDQMPNPRNKLPKNVELDLERRSFGQIDRTWSAPEFNKMLCRALMQKNERYITLLYLARYSALRIHEIFRIDTNMATRALKDGYMHIKGKGGRWRDVPVNDLIRMQLTKLLGVTPRGHKLFVDPDDKTDLAITRFQHFISAEREHCRDTDSDRPMTFHGLRHTCAAEWYKHYKSNGCTDFVARKKVSALLGHGRDDVTRIYLASLKKDGDGHV